MSAPRPRCPVCGTPVTSSAARGRPKIYCSTECRWRAGHLAARERAREQRHQRTAAWLAALPGAGQLAELAPSLDLDELAVPG
jgi:hypothetical protein